jgi:hypothetical protein
VATLRREKGRIRMANNKFHWLIIELTGHLSSTAFSEYRNLDGYVWERGSNLSRVNSTPDNLLWLLESGFNQDDIEKVVIALEELTGIESVG